MRSCAEKCCRSVGHSRCGYSSHSVECHEHGDAILQMDYAYYDMHFLIHFLMDYCKMARGFVKIYPWGTSLEEGCFH